jgi:phosphoribosylglycinamide formyltransferase 1
LKRFVGTRASAPKKRIVGNRASAPGRRIVVLVSGEGSNLQALMDAIASGSLEARIVLVVSSNPGARALERAAAAGIPTLSRPYVRDGSLDPAASRAVYDRLLADEILAQEPDFVFLLGWMRILGDAFVSRFPGKIVNLHPALPGAFPGTDAIARAWMAAREGVADKAGARESGVMTHFVPDAGVDSGPPIEVERVEIMPGSSLAEFEAEMHSVEHRLVVKTVLRLLAGDGNPEGE